MVSATDPGFSSSSEHACEVVKEGLAVSARHLSESVRALPEATVSFMRAQNNYRDVSDRRRAGSYPCFTSCTSLVSEALASPKSMEVFSP